MSSEQSSEVPPPEWNVEIPYELVSPNRLMRMHYRTRMREHDRVYNLLWTYGRPLAEFKCPVNVHITRLWGKRQRGMDEDNLYGACKILIDALKKPKGRSRKGLSVILDDDPSHVSLKVVQQKDDEGLRRVRVKVYPR